MAWESTGSTGKIDKKQKRILFGGALAVLVVLGIIGMYRDHSKAGLVEALAEAAKEMQANLPARINNVTTMETVFSQGLLLTYGARIDMSIDRIDDTMIQNLKSHLTRDVCNYRENMIALMKEGARYAWIYNSSEGFQVARIELGAKECRL